MKSLKTIVFITGSYLGNNCWDEWIVFFQNKGYQCLAPGWPNKDATPEDLRNRHPHCSIASNTLSIVTEYYARIVDALPNKPVLIGHSLGGLILQILVQDGKATAGVAIHSFPPQGIGRFKFSFLQASWQAMGFFSRKCRSYMIPFRKWQKFITNGMTCEEQKESYYKYAIPESKQVMRDIFKCRTKVSFNNASTPLLFTSGGKDKVVNAAVNYENYKTYKQADSIISYKNFEAQNHLVFGQPSWRKEADFILCWLQGINK